MSSGFCILCFLRAVDEQLDDEERAYLHRTVGESGLDLLVVRSGGSADEVVRELRREIPRAIDTGIKET